MKTLSKKHTAQFFVDENGYKTLVKRWSEIVNSDQGKTLTSSDFLLYLILRGKNYHKSFFPGRKMQHYDMPEGFYIARLKLLYDSATEEKFKANFGDILAPDCISNCKKLLGGCYAEDEEPYMESRVEKLMEEPLVVKPSKITNIIKNIIGGS